MRAQGDGQCIAHLTACVVIPSLFAFILTHQQDALCSQMNDPLPRSQFKGLSKTLSRDSKEGWRGALGEYYFLTLIGPCPRNNQDI